MTPGTGNHEHPFWREFVITIISVLLTFCITYFVPILIHNQNAPPPDSVVIHLMDQDVQAALHHDGELATQIYSPKGVIIDAGCQSPNSGVVFAGLEKIKQRYDSLPAFASLAHANIHVTWIPDDKSATQATAVADTIGALETSTGGTTPIRGHEQWIFASSGSQWLVTSFTYNLCLPAS